MDICAIIRQALLQGGSKARQGKEGGANVTHGKAAGGARPRGAERQDAARAREGSWACAACKFASLSR